MRRLQNSCPRLVSEEEVQLQAERLRRLGPTVNWEVAPGGKRWKLMRIDQVIRHFWERVNTSGDCWTWSACRNERGYGVLGFRGTTILAHRMSHILCHGQVPCGLFVLHKCDNPPCVNPAHLFLGTDLDNKRDMVAKGRNSRGETVSKLSESQVLEIVRRYRNEGESEGLTMKSLAKEFGVHFNTINFIVNGHRWAWLTKITASCTRPSA